MEKKMQEESRHKAEITDKLPWGDFQLGTRARQNV